MVHNSVLYDRKSETCSLDLARAALVNAVEALENPSYRLLRYSHTCIAYCYNSAFWQVSDLYKIASALVIVLYSVIAEVCYDLIEDSAVSFEYNVFAGYIVADIFL